MQPGNCRLILILLFLPALFGPAEEWTMPPIRIPPRTGQPLIACTPPELQRLKEARAAGGARGRAVERMITAADAVLDRPVQFPPRGGQHNQWYQCEPCQMGLVKQDAAGHRCPVCGKVYTGPPFDDVIFSEQHIALIENAHAAAWAYVMTGKEVYARYTAQVLLGYAERYLTYPYHDNNCRTGKDASPSGGRLFEQTLGEASRMATRIAPAFDLIFDALTDSERIRIREGLIRPMLDNMDKHKAGKSNWQTWHNAGMLWGGVMLDDAGWVAKALNAPDNGFTFQMEASVTDDGMWYENSWGYHFYTLSAVVQITEGARRIGIDLWHHPRLERMFTLPVSYTMADGSLPRFGDDVHSSLSAVTRLLEPAYAALCSGAIGTLLPREPSWEAVLHGRDTGPAAPVPVTVPVSAVFPAAGHAILGSRGAAGLTAALTFGPYGGFHGHLDKLSFVLFGCGTELGVDPGRAKSQAYRLPIHSRWYKASLSHNTVLVGLASQAPAEGTLEAFAANDTCALVLAACDAAFKGVTHRRLLLLAPQYALVFDVLESSEPVRFDWVYHNRGLTVESAAAADTGGLPEYPGSEFIRNARSGRTEAPVNVLFKGSNADVYLKADGCPGTTVLIGDGPGASVADRVPLVMLGREGRQARFACVLEPVPAGEADMVTHIGVASEDGTDTVTIVIGAVTHTVTVTGRRVAFRNGTEWILRTE